MHEVVGRINGALAKHVDRFDEVTVELLCVEGDGTARQLTQDERRIAFSAAEEADVLLIRPARPGRIPGLSYSSDHVHEQYLRAWRIGDDASWWQPFRRRRGRRLARKLYRRYCTMVGLTPPDSL